MSIGVAIIGSGIFVREAHLPAILATPTLSIKAIFSRTLASATTVSATLNPTPDLYATDAGESKSLSSLLARSDIHAVIIALPIPHQPEYIKQCLAAGKHVLAEKPIAPTVAQAQDLISWYRANVDTSKVCLAIAEQFRYFPRFHFAAGEVKRLGRVLGFRLRLNTLVKQGSKYIETVWRKEPEYQGGFLLDGGVHFIAGMRVMLPDEAAMERVSAYSAQLQKYLPPVDTVDASVKLRNGATGTVAISFGTTFTGGEWVVACENGTVEVQRGLVKVVEGGNETTKDFSWEDNGVQSEVKAWAESLEKGKWDAMQTPEEALADLEVLEAMLKSGDADGKPVALTLQT